MRRFIIAVALTSTLGACGISPQQEVQMGADYAAQVEQQLPIVQDPQINSYINVLGDSIAKLADGRDLDWHFRIVDSREVNAFAIPGGYIYVNRGLIERTTNMAQLAGVLGHEIGHVTQRHSVKQMESMQRAQLGVGLACVLTNVCNNQAAGTAINVAGGALFAKFSRDDETEADVQAVKNVVRAGIHPEGIPQMFEILLNERNSATPGGVDAWFRTHPIEEDRIENTRKLSQAVDPAIRRQLRTDSENYQVFKRRVQSLPPSPTPRAQPR